MENQRHEFHAILSRAHLADLKTLQVELIQINERLYSSFSLLSFVYELPYLWEEKRRRRFPEKRPNIHGPSDNDDRFIETATPRLTTPTPHAFICLLILNINPR